MTDKTVKTIGWIATALCVCMYFSYIDQIQRNLAGNKGSVLLPFITTLNSTAWVFYGALKKPKDWPISNFPGIVLGLVTVVTAI